MGASIHRYADEECDEGIPLLMAMPRYPRRGWRVTLGLAAAVLVWSAISASPVAAHAELTSISPEDGVVLVEPPTSIDLTFSEPLITAAATVVVTDDRGVVVTRDRSQVDGRAVSVLWPADAPSGDYTIAYRVVSGDGHPIKGTSRFTLRQPVPTPTPETSGAPTPETSGASTPETSPRPTAGSAGSQTSDPATATAQAAAGSAPADPGQGPRVPLPIVALVAGIAAALAVGAALLVRRRRAT